MKRSFATAGLVIACLGLVYGCGDDDDDNGGGSGRAGTSGTAGRGGTGGGGTAGHGGTGGHGGTSGRGTMTGGKAGHAEGGTSGNAEGGAAGHAGGGASGMSGGGSGNQGGSCDADATPHKLSSACEPVPIWEGGYEDSLTTNCSFEAACEAVKCGTLWSAYDANMCRRPLCHSSAECGSGERCIAPPLVGDFNCYFNAENNSDFYEHNLQSDCSCLLELSECAPRAYCVSAADYPPADDCPVASMTCDQLNDLAFGVVGPFDWLSPITSAAENTSDLVIALSDCASKSQDAYAACEGHGGNGGGHGGESAGHGGESGARSQ